MSGPQQDNPKLEHREVAKQFAPELKHALRTFGHRRLELEFRLGHRTAGGKFVPGVTEAHWERLKSQLDRASSERHFKVSESDTLELLSDDGSGAKYVIDNGRGTECWIHKKRLANRDVDVEGTPWGCRASISLEVEEPCSERQPAPTKHRYERRKRRWSYRHKCWSVDLTRVSSNLPHQADNDGLSYEVEIELVDQGAVFERTAEAVLDWGFHFVRDLCGLAAAQSPSEIGVSVPNHTSAAPGSAPL